MDESRALALKEFIDVISDRNWHEVYEIHQRYRLPPVLISMAIEELLRLKIIIKVGHRIRLVDNLTNEVMSKINRIQKTKRPSILREYKSIRLT